MECSCPKPEKRELSEQEINVYKANLKELEKQEKYEECAEIMRLINEGVTEVPKTCFETWEPIVISVRFSTEKGWESLD